MERGNFFEKITQAGAVGITGLSLGVAAENATAVDNSEDAVVVPIGHIEKTKDPLAKPSLHEENLFVPPKDTATTVVAPIVVEKKIDLKESFVEPEESEAITVQNIPERVEIPKTFSLEDNLRHDPNLAQFLHSWQRKKTHMSPGDRRLYSTDMNKLYADFRQETKLKIYTGLFTNSEAQMGKYYRKLIEKETYRKQVHEAIINSSTEFGVPLDVVYGVIGVESGGDMDKISSRGAVGLMQVRHSTALAELIRIANIPEYRKIFGGVDRWTKMEVGKFKDNVAIGVAYLRYLYEKYNDWNLAMMAFNAGPGYFEKSLVRLHNKTVTDKFSSDHERGLNRGKLSVEKPQTVIYDVVKKDYGKFLKENYPSFAILMTKAGADGLNVSYVLRAMLLAEMTRLAVEEGRIK